MREVDLPQEWKLTAIDKVLAPQADGKLIHQGWSPQCEQKPAAENEWGVLKTTAIQDGFFLDHENKRLPKDKAPKKRIEVTSGDVLITNAGPRNRCGIICYVKKTRSKLMLSGKMYRLRFPEAFICPKYIELWLRTSYAQKELNNRKTGISESGLNMTQVKFLTLPILVAPLQEQKIIAEKLDALLAKVEATKTRLEKIPEILKRFRQSVLSAAICGKLTEQWRLKNKASIESWQKGILNDFIESASYGSSSKSDVAGLVPVLRMGNLQNGKIDWSDLVYTSNQYEIEKYHLDIGDVLFNRTNSPELVGKTSIYNGEKEAIYAGYLIRIKCKKKLNSKYLNYHLNSPFAKEYCQYVKSDGVSQSNINAQKLRAYPMQLPSVVEQAEIVRQVEMLFAFADNIEEKVKSALERVNNLTQSILAKAFRGELTAKWREENPELISGENSAEALLAKIKLERENLASTKNKRQRKTV